MSREPALVMRLPVAAGQREERFTHLLAGEPDLSSIAPKSTKATASTKGQATNPDQNSLAQNKKIDELEARIARLEKALDMPFSNGSE